MDLIFHKESLGPWTFLRILIKIMNKKRQQKLRRGVTRENQKRQGYFDGRFVERSERVKKLYTRKNKHKNKGYGGDEN